MRVGVAGVSRAVAMESGMPGDMDPGGIAAGGRSECRLRILLAWAACSTASPSVGRGARGVWRAPGVTSPAMAGRGIRVASECSASCRPCPRSDSAFAGSMGGGRMPWPGGASPAMAGRGISVTSIGTGGGGVGGRRLPLAGGAGMGALDSGVCDGTRPLMSGWVPEPDAEPRCAAFSWSGGRGGGGRFAAAGGGLHLL